MSVRAERIKVTHVPTGEQAELDDCAPYPYSRSMFHMRLTAIRILRSRLAAERSQKLVAVYELPDDVPYPHDLLRFRSPAVDLEAKEATDADLHRMDR